MKPHSAGSPISVKWVENSDEGVLVTSDAAAAAFKPVWAQPTNLISIFGRARQGKSFLMNCLAGEHEVFRISNEKESCTQGIDLSTKFLPLHQFSTIDGGAAPRSVATPFTPHIGFVDAEGQGDKDVSYDANLICPILLASKVVVFNWKGDLQKDHILSTLGIMTRAAQNIQQAGAKFGHLHIVFRDWQAVNSNEASTHEALFGMESSRDAATRNQIRHDVLAAFQSVRVWLFEAPVDKVADLRKRLSIEMTTPTFRAQVRALRTVLSSQLAEPTVLAGVAMSGKGICGMVRQCIDTLNRGEAVLPSSAYLAMIRQEMQVGKDEFTMRLQQALDGYLEKYQRRPVTGLFPKPQDVTESVSALADLVYAEFEAHQHKTVGTSPSPACAGLLHDTLQQFHQASQRLQDHIVKDMKLIYIEWLRDRRSIAESRLHEALANLLADEMAYSEDQLSTLVASTFKTVLAPLLGTSGHFDDPEYFLVHSSLEALWRELAGRLQQANQQRIARAQELAAGVERKYRDLMAQEVAAVVQGLQQCGAPGMLEEDVTRGLNISHAAMVENIAVELRGNALAESAADGFTRACVELKREVEAAFKKSCNRAFHASFDGAAEQLSDVCGRLVEEWDCNIANITPEQIARSTEAEVRKLWLAALAEVRLWMGVRDVYAVPADDLCRHPFARDLLQQLQVEANGFVERAIEVLQAHEQEEEDVSLAEAKGEDDAGDELSLPAPRGASKGGPVSVAEQRRRAKEWAMRTLGPRKPQKRAAGAAQKTSLVSTLQQVRKSTEQQRRDAWEFAKKAFALQDDAVDALPAPVAAASVAPPTAAADGSSPIRVRPVTKEGSRMLAEAREAARQQQEARAKEMTQRLTGQSGKKKRAAK